MTAHPQDPGPEWALPEWALIPSSSWAPSSSPPVGLTFGNHL